MFSDFQMPIITILIAGGLGSQAELDAFNYFFSLAIAGGFLMFMVVAIIRLIMRS